MIEIAPDAPDWDEYEAEQARHSGIERNWQQYTTAMSGLEKKRDRRCRKLTY